MNKTVILVPFSSSLINGCDYSLQTLAILGKKNYVYGVQLAEPYTWKSLLKDIFGKKCTLYSTGDRYSIFRLPFLIPGQRFKKIEKANYLIGSLLLRVYFYFKHGSCQKILWLFEPYQTITFFKLFKSYFKLYDCVDYFQATSSEVKQDEQYILSHSDLVALNSRTLQRLHGRINPHTILVPVGFPDAIFTPFSAQVKKFQKKKRLIIGYIGGINDRLNFKLLRELVTLHPQDIFKFVGPMQVDNNVIEPEVLRQVELLKKMPNTQWIDNQPKSAIPGIILSMDICLIPYDIRNPFNRYCYPMKLLDYFFFQKPVISTAIEELKYFPSVVMIGDSAADFSSHINDIRNNGWSATKGKYQQEVALSNTWEKKVTLICEAIEKRLKTS
ncbi:MAG: hypothetical protein M3Q81_03350 [bacterium]|nr:hypothetical protein [bacterium]